MNEQEKIILDVIEIALKEATCVNMDKFSIDAHLYNDLFMDELDYAELAIKLEDEVGIELPMEMDEFKTIRDMVIYISKRYDLSIKE